MSLRDYIAAKAVPLCLAGIGCSWLLLISALCGIPVSLLTVLFLNVLLAAVLAVWIGWYRFDHHLRELKNRLNGLSVPYVIGETLDCPHDPLEYAYFYLMKEISRSAVSAVEEAKAEQQEYREYVEQWIHEIKTPLTACALILANGGDAMKLRRELKRADNLTETILTYARLSTAEKDLQISRVDLHTVCDQALREEMELLIAADIGAVIDGEGSVYSDPKLLVFILKQLIINCAKYCPGCRIEIRIDTDTLVFSDSGPGIPAHELCRVTERGFTGGAARTENRGTGMGLYIVRVLCEKLHINMEIASEVGLYTRFIFHFPT